MPVKIFFCYAHEDARLRKELEKQLGLLKRQALIDTWNDRNISAGTIWEREIDKHLNTAQVILLLISPDFLDSDYCYSIEMKQAMERHERREAHVIPIILRPCDWHSSPFGKLQALPENGKAITTWSNRDSAFLDVAKGIRKVVEEQNIIISANQLAHRNSPANDVSIVHTITVSNLKRLLTQAPKPVNAKIQQYKPGDRVRHDKFGDGIVLKSEMEQGTLFVEVQFQGNQGKKRFSMDIAKLEKI